MPPCNLIMFALSLLLKTSLTLFLQNPATASRYFMRWVDQNIFRNLGPDKNTLYKWSKCVWHSSWFRNPWDMLLNTIQEETGVRILDNLKLWILTISLFSEATSRTNSKRRNINTARNETFVNHVICFYITGRSFIRMFGLLLLTWWL